MCMHMCIECVCRAMFVYFNRLLFKSISLLPLRHFISLLPFSLFFFSFPSCLSPPSSFPFPLAFLPSSSSPLLFLPSFSYPSIPSNFSISSYLLFPNSSPSFLSIPPFLGRLLPVQPLISFLFLH